MSGKLSPKIKRNRSNGDSIFKIEEFKMAFNIANRVYFDIKPNNKEDIIIMLGVLWSDDFDPNSSLKSNRGSVWVKTLTLISNDKRGNDETNTYIISLEHKGCDHDDIEETIVNKLIEVETNDFYSSASKKR